MHFKNIYGWDKVEVCLTNEELGAICEIFETAKVEDKDERCRKLYSDFIIARALCHEGYIYDEDLQNIVENRGISFDAKK